MSKEALRKAIQAMAKQENPISNTAWCEVKSVTNQTCTIVLDDLDIEGILLGFENNGVIVYPKANSRVLVGFIGKSKTNGVVLMATEVEKIELMGSVNKGLVKVDVAKNNMEQLKSYCEAMKTATSTALGTIDGIIGTMSKTAFDIAMASVTITLADMENVKVKHGNG